MEKIRILGKITFRAFSVLLLDALKDRKVFFFFLLSVLVFLIGIIANIALPFLFKTMVDRLYAKHYDFIALLCFFYGIIWIISQANVHIKDFFSNKVEIRLSASFMEKVMDRIFDLPIGQYQDYRTGEIVSMIQRIKNAMPNIVAGLFFYIVPTLIEVSFVSVLLMYHYNYSYSLIMLATLVSFLAYNLTFNETVGRLSADYVKADQENDVVALDLLMNYETIKYLSAQKRIRKIYVGQFKSWEIKNARSRSLLSLIRAGQSCVLGVGVIVLALMSAYGVKNGAMSAGGFVLFIGYLIQFSAPLNIIGYTLKNIRQYFVELKEPLKLLNTRRRDKPCFVRTLNHAPIIEFKTVNLFHGRKHVLKDLSFRIKPAEKLIVTGETGIGKTTLAKCLLKIHPINGGEILIGGVSLDKLTAEHLMKSVAYFPQDVQLLSGSLYENLSITEENISLNDMLHAVADAQLSEFLKKRFNNDLYACIGERGIKLSGGEKQRIGLARLFLKNFDICILDEPFSSIDGHTSAKIFEKMMSKFQEKTVIIISHQIIAGMENCRMMHL